MADTSFMWSRFWCPRDCALALTSDGFLLDPQTPTGSAANPDVVPFQSIEGEPCLVLLGEPGLGKTTALRQHREATDRRLTDTGIRVLWKDLNAYSSDTRLVQAVFEDRVFTTWADGDGVLHLFLDSLDECLLRIETLASLLAEELVKYPVKRLRLRLACRTAIWPALLERRLRELWGKDAVGVYELAPLRRCDVASAAIANGIDAGAFLAEIDRREAGPLASRPVTLRFLLAAFQRGEGLPQTQTELYTRGCEQLCAEISESRRAAQRTGNLSPRQRLALATRIAAVSLFCARPILWTGSEGEEIPEGDLPLSQLVGGPENSNGHSIEVTETLLREVLDTGLFSGRGLERVGFSHQTYAEFLAADYLIRRGLNLPQITSLIAHPGGEGKIFPQLQETAAWLATRLPPLAEQILKTDPQVLLHSDVSTLSAATRQALVASLLQLFDAGSLIDSDWGERTRYRKLSHPGLAAQLRPYISDRTKNNIVRRVAIDIAEACRLQELQELFADIALDRADNLPTREQAAFAVARIGDRDARLRLKPCLMDTAEEDLNDELKGAALEALWPKDLSVAELLPALTAPKNNSFYGRYQHFLRERLMEHIQAPMLPHMLQWAARQPILHSHEGPLQFVVHRVMEIAWEHVDEPGIWNALVPVVVRWLTQHSPIAFINAAADAEKRHKLADAVSPILLQQEKPTAGFWLVHGRTPLLYSGDLCWAIEKVRSASAKEDTDFWLGIVNALFRPEISGHLDTLLAATVTCPSLAQAFAPLLTPVSLDSPEAKRQREEHRKWEELRRVPRGEEELLNPPPDEQVRLLLNRAEAGDLDAWWRLIEVLKLNQSSMRVHDVLLALESDLTILPGWKAADSTTRHRILTAARQYVIERQPRPETWLGTDTFHRADMAGYRALGLLGQEEPAVLYQLQPEAWQKWAAIIVAYPTPIGMIGDEVHQHFVRIAYSHAPEEVIRAILASIDRENRNGDSIFIHRKAESCWDASFAAAMIGKVREPNLKPSCMGSLLESLLQHAPAEGAEFAASLISLPIPVEEEARRRAVIAAALLLALVPDRTWQTVWTAMQVDNAFGREVIMQVAGRHDQDYGSLAQRLTEEEVADLYYWLVRQFPPAEDPQHEGAHFVEVRENVAHFRDAVLQQLIYRGTERARRAVERLATLLPELSWLRWAAVQARTTMLQQTWVPPTPEVLLRLGRDRDLRFVESGEQLLEVIIESLERLTQELQGETPAAPDLWNRLENNTFRPKDEEELSNYIARFLRRDIKQRAIVVNREVEIRRGEGKAKGELTDIHVDATAIGCRPNEYDRITVIIEVKGCWNQRLDGDMQGQLRDRYLRDNRCQHGLYLVGWFSCPQWDDKDYRESRSPKMTIAEAQQHFDQQATALSTEQARLRALVLNTALR